MRYETVEGAPERGAAGPKISQSVSEEVRELREARVMGMRSEQSAGPRSCGFCGHGQDVE